MDCSWYPQLKLDMLLLSSPTGQRNTTELPNLPWNRVSEEQRKPFICNKSLMQRNYISIHCIILPYLHNTEIQISHHPPQHECQTNVALFHDDVIIWNIFRVTGPFVRGIHRSPANPLHKGQWSEALMFSLICTWTNGWVNDQGAGDLRRHRAHYNVTIMHT